MVTLSDIALKMGLNVSTVSRALRGSTDISKETCRLAKKIAKELGYQYRKTAVTRNSIIGVILPELSSHYYSELAHLLFNEIHKQGYGMQIALSGSSFKGIDEVFEQFIQEDVCGILIGGIGIGETNSEHLDHWLSEQLLKSEVPVVLLGEIETDSAEPIDMIYVDAYGCMQIAVEHLMSLGHTQIGYVGEYLSHKRFKVMLRIMKQKGLAINPDYMKQGEERFELGGYLRTRELLAEKALPTAIIACYDQVAIGAMKALNEAGLKIPEDISIIGFDNIVSDEYLPVKLTSITNPVGQISVVALKLLLDNINHKEEHVIQNVALMAKLVVRNSTAIPNR
jgi:DNA-binding LacI/PurR family transcriptional regulator